MISFLGYEIKNYIIERAKQAKYISLILDFTPDISHQQQLSFYNSFWLKELFKKKKQLLPFIPIDDTTGESLTTPLLKEIEGTCESDMKNCRAKVTIMEAPWLENIKECSQEFCQCFVKLFSILVDCLLYTSQIKKLKTN